MGLETLKMALKYPQKALKIVNLRWPRQQRPKVPLKRHSKTKLLDLKCQSDPPPLEVALKRLKRPYNRACHHFDFS